MQVLHGCSLEILKSLPESSVDSVVTDPPYGLKFMSKHWDYDVPSPDLWREVLRVMKPGAHLVSFGGSRTYHRMAVAIEDAGFEIRDQIMWLYGSGFPKSMDVSKAIDKAAGVEREVIGVKKGDQPATASTYNKQVWSAERSVENGRVDTLITAPATDDAKKWQGFGTALKPAHEPIVLARKPLSEKTVAANVLKWGAGALNIDASRIGTSKRHPGNYTDNKEQCSRTTGIYGSTDRSTFDAAQGRWPANLLLSCTCGDCEDGQLPLIHETECAVGELDRQSGISKSAGGDGYKNSVFCGGKKTGGHGLGDSGGASRFFYVAKASKRERNAGLEGMPIQNTWTESRKPNSNDIMTMKRVNSRTGELEDRKDVTKAANHHPTVKPIKLMQYLINLITPPGGTVLDCFAGSGSTGVAAAKLGFKFIGIERENEYVEIANKRIEAALG